MSIRVNCAVKVTLKRVNKRRRAEKIPTRLNSKLASMEEEDRDEGKQTVWGVKLRWVKNKVGN